MKKQYTYKPAGKRPDAPKPRPRPKSKSQPKEQVSDWAFPNWSANGGVLLIKTLKNLEGVLAQELKELGATEVQELTRAVSCKAGLKLLYKTNYHLRTALRVLVPVHAFHASNEKAFYKGVRELDWSQFLHPNDSFAVETVMHKGNFKNSHFMSLLCKDAVVDQFRDRYNERPSINTEHPKVRIHVHIREERVQLLLDSSGTSLHLRGYRRDRVDAPLSEVLAAGMIRLSGWDPSTPFADPMCGSGTLPIEAAMMARNIPAQKFRERFAFENWRDFDEKLWSKIQREGIAAENQNELTILASDKDPRARNATKINLMAAELDEAVEVERRPFHQCKPPAESGTLITNPPYDERLPLKDAQDFYSKMGDILKQNWTGWTAWIITANMEASKAVGLRASKNIALLNGSLECKFQGFDLYAGSKKAQ